MGFAIEHYRDEAVGHLGAIVIGGEPMAAGPEMRGDHAEHRQEPGGNGRGTEPRRREFREQAQRFGTEFLNTWIDEVDLSSRPFTLYGKESEDSEQRTTIERCPYIALEGHTWDSYLGTLGRCVVFESRFSAVRRFRSSMIALGWIFSWM